MIIFEAPHRIERTLKDLKEYLGDRQIAVCREITKIFEESLRGKISEMITHFEKTKPRGEFVLVLGDSLEA